MPLKTRMRSLDIFRGLTVVGMILVNCSGSDDVYALLEHAPWHGLTLADMVFPSFLFIVGLSSVLSHAARVSKGQTPASIAAHTLGRAAGLFALGLLVNFVIFPGSGGMRWPGVLQRIAVCSMGASILLWLDSPLLELLSTVGLLLGYWLLMTHIPVPGHGAGVLTPEGNLASWLDRRLMGGHLMTPWEDPEGLLSTLPALATTFLGVISGRRLMRYGASTREILKLCGAGMMLAVMGWAWSYSFPWNKHLWTSSYVLTTGGVCLLGLGLMIMIFGETPPRAFNGIESLGRHALAAYVLCGLIYGIQEFAHAPLPDGSVGNVKLWITAHAFLPWLSPRAASMAYALFFTFLTALAFAWVERRRDIRPTRL